MAEDTGEGQQGISRRDVLKGALGLGGAAAVGKLGYEGLQELGVIPEEVEVTKLSDLLLSQGENPSKWDSHTNRHLITEGYLKRLSTEGKSPLGESYLYGLFPQEPSETDLPATMDEYHAGASNGKFLPVFYFDNSLNQFFRGEKHVKDVDPAPPVDGSVRIKGLFQGGFPGQESQSRRANLLIGPEDVKSIDSLPKK